MSGTRGYAKTEAAALQRLAALRASLERQVAAAATTDEAPSTDASVFVFPVHGPKTPGTRPAVHRPAPALVFTEPPASP